MKKTFFTLSLLFVLFGCNTNQNPDDVSLESLNQDFTGVIINWNQSTEPDFHSYKLYRHTSSGIDESTGELIHIETEIANTSYIDETIIPSETYYYRVYVVTDNGTSNGSNIENITTETISFAQNGSFELSSTEATYWQLIENNINEPANSIDVDTMEASEGNHSLKFYHNSGTGCWEQWINQVVPLENIYPETTYNISFDYKSYISLSPGAEMGFRLYNNTMNIQIPLPAFSGDGNWHTFTSDFTIPANIGSTDPTLSLHFCRQGVGSWWVDNINIVKI